MTVTDEMVERHGVFLYGVWPHTFSRHWNMALPEERTRFNEISRVALEAALSGKDR